MGSSRMMTKRCLEFLAIRILLGSLGGQIPWSGGGNMWLDWEGIGAAGRDYYVKFAREEPEEDEEDTEGISHILSATEDEGR